jgi:hypothetical protein
MGLAWSATRRLAGVWAAWAVVAVVGASPLVWRAFSGVGSEGPALACVAACGWGLVPSRARAERGWAHAIALGVGAGLGLGVRLSWAPMFVALLALAPRGERLRAWGTAAVAGAAWAVPLVLLVGGPRLASLYAEHLAGHAERWGGTIATTPGLDRLGWLARDVFVDGLGAGDHLLGIVLGAVLAAAVVEAIAGWRASGWRDWPAAVVVVVPYLVWIALGQNLRDQPRHALPIVALLGGALALRATRSPRALVIVCTLALLLAVRTSHDAMMRRSVAPPSQQLVDLVRAQPRPDRVAVFGAASVRFFEGTELAGRALPAAALGDVEVQLARLDALPARVWVTSEVERLGETRAPFVRVATLCRPPRIDRRARCIDVDEWRLPYLPPE